MKATIHDSNTVRNESTTGQATPEKASIRFSQTLLEDRSEANVILLQSEVDYFGLTPSDIRVYVHLANRAAKGEAYPCSTAVAKHCNLTLDEVRKSVRVLLDANILKCVDHPTLPNAYVLTPHSQWIKPFRASRESKGSTQVHFLADQDSVANPAPQAAITPLQQHAVVITDRLHGLHAENCRVHFSQPDVINYAKSALDNGHSEEQIVSAYQTALNHCHDLIVKEVDIGRRQHQERTSPHLTIWLAQQQLKQDGKSPSIRWDEIIARSNADKEARAKAVLSEVKTQSQMHSQNNTQGCQSIEHPKLNQPQEQCQATSI